MHTRQLKSRIERLERPSVDGDCDGCNRTVAMEAREMMAAEERGEVWRPTRRACPVCRNPHPQMSIAYFDRLYGDSESGEDR